MSTTNANKKPYFKISPSSGGTYLIVGDIEDAYDEINDDLNYLDGESLTIERIYLSDDEVEDMPEFDGF